MTKGHLPEMRTCCEKTGLLQVCHHCSLRVDLLASSCYQPSRVFLPDTQLCSGHPHPQNREPATLHLGESSLSVGYITKRQTRIHQPGCWWQVSKKVCLQKRCCQIPLFSQNSPYFPACVLEFMIKLLSWYHKNKPCYTLGVFRL